MDKRFWIIVSIILVVFVGFIIVNNKDKASAPESKTKGQATNNVRGEGPVTLVEYGDFQCPACAQYYPVIEEVFNKYSNDITFQFRNFPLVSIHPNAFAASRAGEAASKQGKFWEMYDKLYSNQTDWSANSKPMSNFEVYAKQIGLNVDTFKKDFSSSAVNNAIQADIAAGEKLKVQSTPSFILDGKLIKNPQPTLEAFSKIIDEAIAEKNKKSDN